MGPPPRRQPGPAARSAEPHPARAAGARPPAHAALPQHLDDALLCYSKTDPAETGPPVLVVVNLDARQRQQGFVDVDLAALGLPYEIELRASSTSSRTAASAGTGRGTSSTSTRRPRPTSSASSRHEPRSAGGAVVSDPDRVDGPPDWYRDAIIYELHVRAFADSNGDGIGDFNGLAHRLDYLADLGVTAIWLLPFYPSPLRDDGYDIADYRTVHPDYGDLRQFRRFLDAAHARNIRVITELVVNHTSDQHPWFQDSRRAPPRLDRARLLRVERHHRPLRRRPHHLPGLRAVQLDVGPAGRVVLLAPLLLAPARPQLRQPRRRGGASSTSSTTGSTWASTACASTPCRTCTSARAPTARTSTRPTTSSSGCASTWTPATPTACCSPRPTSGRRTPPPTSATATSAT